MWARHPRNLAPAPFVRDVMRERSECPINPEIGNSYLLSDAETTESDRPFTYLSTANY